MKGDIIDLKESNILLNHTFDKKEEAIRASGELLVEDGAVESDYIKMMLLVKKLSRLIWVVL